MPLASPLNLKFALTFTEVMIMNKWMCTFCGTIYDEKKAGPKKVSRLVLSLKISQMIGSALIAA